MWEHGEDTCGYVAWESQISLNTRSILDDTTRGGNGWDMDIWTGILGRGRRNVEHISMDLWGVEDWITATAMVTIVASATRSFMTQQGFSWSCGRSSTMSPSSTCTTEFWICGWSSQRKDWGIGVQVFQGQRLDSAEPSLLLGLSTSTGWTMRI